MLLGDVGIEGLFTSEIPYTLPRNPGKKSRNPHEIFWNPKSVEIPRRSPVPFHLSNSVYFENFCNIPMLVLKVCDKIAQIVLHADTKFEKCN